MEWSAEKIEMLISLYSAEPHLYNCREADYHNKVKRSASLADIAQALATTADEVKRKWSNLRSQYGEELRKSRTCNSGMGTDAVYVPKWKWFSLMSFMQDHVSVTNRTTLTNLSLEITETEGTDGDGDTSQTHDPSITGSSTSAEPSTSHASDSSTTKCTLPSRQKRKSSDSSTTTGVESSMDSLAKYFDAKRARQPEDPDLAFGKLIGLELAKIPDESVKKSMKQKILNVVYGTDEEPKIQYYVVGQDNSLHRVEM